MAIWYPSNFTLDLRVQNLSMNQIYIMTIDSAKAKDLSGNELDGDGDGTAGGDFIFSFYVTTQQPAKLIVTVVDRSNQPIIGANVSLYLNGSLIRKAQTSGNGMVEFNDLMPGSYRIKAEKEGYIAAVHDVTLKFGQTENATLSLLRSSEVEAEFAWLFWLLPLIVIVAVLSLVLLILQKRNKKECPECEKRVPVKSNVCQYCGYDFIRKKARVSKAEMDEEEIEKPTKPDVPKTIPETVSRSKHERIGPASPVVLGRVKKAEQPVETEALRIKDRRDRTMERDETRPKPRSAVPMGAIEESEEDLEVKTGMNTLLLTSENRWCFEKFKSLMSSNAHGLCISTMQPNKIRIRYKIQRASLYWLTDTSTKENILNPKRLDFEITKVILEFIKTKKNGIILIDGLEYLISENGFEKVNRFIKKVSDLASNYDHTLIMMINPSALAPDPLSILKKNFDDVVEKW